LILIILLICLLQGFTEFIPVSSQGHLIVFNFFFDQILESNLSILEINIFAHFGSLLAILIYYHRRLLKLLIAIKHIPRPDIDRNSYLLIQLFVSTLPIIFAGYLFGNFFTYETSFTILIIGLSSIIFGLLIGIVDQFCLRIKNIDSLNLRSALMVGFFQCFALIPGVSRSGAIMTILRFKGFRRDFCVFYSNLLSIPAILGATIFIILENDFIITGFLTNIYTYLIIVFSFIFSLIFIHFLVSWVRKSSLLIFVIYRLLFGSLLLFFYLNY